MAYYKNETPMPSYINAHAVLQSKRMLARAAGIPGPRAVIVGPRDSGKTALVRILAAYCVKANGRAVVVDLDPSGCGAAGVVPASVALSVVKHMDLEAGGLMHERVQCVMLGHTTPRQNVAVSDVVFETMGEVLDGVLSNRDMRPWGGCLVDTSGDVEGADGAEMVIKAVKALNADVVFVIGAERLFAKVKSLLEGCATETVLLAKSGGVVSRDEECRIAMASQAMKDYFYGGDNRLSPFTAVVDFGEVAVYKVGGVASVVPDSVLPIGASSTLDPLKATRITNVGELLHKMLGVSQAEREEEVLKKPVYGFVHVVATDAERNSMKVLAPSAGKIPGKLLLAGDTKWIE